MAMACCWSSHHLLHSFWRKLHCLGGQFSASQKIGAKGFSKLSSGLVSDSSKTAQTTTLRSNLQIICEGDREAFQDPFKNQKGNADLDALNGRVMLIDGTAVMYRSYYKLLARARQEMATTGNM